MVVVVVAVYLSICKLENEAILRDFFSFWTWQQKKTQQFCETSSIFQADDVKHAAILRDFLNFWTWQRQKQKNSGKTSFQERKVECRADGFVPMRYAIFPLHLSKVLRLPWKSDARSYEVLHLSRKIILANLEVWCPKMQPFSGNERPHLLTSLMNMSLVLRLPRDMHLCRSSANVLRLPAKTKSEPSKVVRAWCVL